MKLAPRETLTPEEVQGGLRGVIRDGLASQTMVTLTSGAFLVAFALKLGASNSIIGLLAAIPPLMQLLQIPSVYLVEKIRNRRAISVFASGSGRMCWLFIGLVPLILSAKAALAFLVGTLALIAALGAVSICSWNSWMRDLIPQDQLGGFFSRRMMLAAGLGIVVSIAAGFYIDVLKKFAPHLELHAYSSLYFLGSLAGLYGVLVIATIPEPKMATRKDKLELLRLVSFPIKDGNFRSLISFLGPWNFAVNFAAPFFTVYLLKRLQFDITFVIGLSALSQIMNLAFLRIWGKYTDRFSNKSVLSICCPLFMFSVLAWTFTTLPEKYWGTIPLLVVIHMFLGISTAGVTLAAGNIALKLAPKEQATSFLAANSLINSLAAATSPVLGGVFADFFASREFSVMLNWKSPVREMHFETLSFQHWDFFFFLAFVIGLYSIHRLTKVKEMGEVEERIVIQELIAEMKRPMRTLSTAAGLRKLVFFPFYALRHPLDTMNLDVMESPETNGVAQPDQGGIHEGK